MNAPPPDPIRDRLAAAGHEIEPRWLFDKPAMGIFSGYRLVVRRCEIIYRLEDPETVIIVLYRRLDGPRGNNGFADLVWFLEFLKQGDFGVRRVMGKVDTFRYRKEGGISTRRLAEFYVRCMGGRIIQHQGEAWIHQELQHIVSPRQYRRQQALNF